MKPSEYIKNAIRTESKDYKFAEVNGVTPRIEHAVMGIVTEAGELMDDVKRSKIYDQQLDRIHMVEEAGDCFWYLALLCEALGVTFEEVWEKNINKLEVRYPEKYDHDHAKNRKLDKERKVLEK